MDALPELLHLPKYAGAKNLSSYLGIDDMSYFIRDNVFITKKFAFKPKIRLLITDYDGTVGNYYGGLTEMIDVMIDYLHRTRSMPKQKVETILCEEPLVKDGYFDGYDFFTVEGIAKIIASPYFFREDLREEDKNFFNNELEKALHSMLQHVYADAVDLFKHCQERHVPVVVHTNSCLSELLRKATLSGLIQFTEDEGGNLKVAHSYIDGISAKVDKNNVDLSKEIKALEKFGVFVLANPKEYAKPNPEPIYNIKRALLAKKNIYVSQEHILLLGNDLYDDGGLAHNTGTHYAWPSKHACLSDRDVEINRMTAGGDPKFDHSIFGQMRHVVKALLGERKSDCKEFADNMAICPSYDVLYKEIYNFVPSATMEKINFLKIMLEEQAIQKKIKNRPNVSKKPFELASLGIVSSDNSEGNVAEFSLLNMLSAKTR